jgi:hypothetical protein
MQIDWILVLEWVIKSALLFFILATGFAYTTFYERKLAALIQLRLGPNRAGPGGWLQPAADGVKLFFKEELTPASVRHHGGRAVGRGDQFLRPHGAAAHRRYQRRCTLHSVRSFDLGLRHRAGGLGLEQQIRHAGRAALFGADAQL